MYLVKKPHHTEKALKFNNKGVYVFIVNIEATKSEIKKEIAKLYNVHVLSVNTAVYKGKKVRRYTRKRVIEGKHANYKKAMITLRKGDMIDVYEDNIE